MKKSTYHKELSELLQNLKNSPNQNKTSLLLHACCGPCSSYVLEYLADFFDITILYYNPNIYPPEEYSRRLQELKDLLQKFPPSIKNNVSLIEDSYNPDDFYNWIQIKENPELAKEAEKGERCRRCYELRLIRSFEYAKKNNFDYFCTTLSISPFKDAEKINVLGNEIIQKELEKNSNCKTKWLPSDFKKNSGFLRSLEISQEYGLYRQQYCGCVYSKQNKEAFDEQQKINNSQ